MKSKPSQPSQNYAVLLSDLKKKITSARLQAALSVNKELVVLYWIIGQDILTRQSAEGWGTKVIDRLATDLRHAFPEMKGLSARNLKYMRSFAQAWPDGEFVQQVVALLPWGHNTKLLESVKSPSAREWYARQAIENGWSRNVLVHQVESELYERQGKALTNFTQTLPAEQSELAQQIIKDPYNFDFLYLGSDMLERDLERGLVNHLQSSILELGKGFSFVGRQYHLEVGGQDYYLDLLFYHLRLRCFVVIELKIEDFKPEFAGKLNFYLSAVDDQLRHPDDKPSIGIILCKGKNDVVVEYALRDANKPMGVARYELSAVLPAQFVDELPTVQDLSKEFPAMELLELRINIENALRELTSQLEFNTKRPANIAVVLQELKSRNKAPASTDSFLPALQVMNKAAHGQDIDSDSADKAVSIGRQFLRELISKSK